QGGGGGAAAAEGGSTRGAGAVHARRRRVRRGRGRLGALLESLVALPWAIPGTVFAVALAVTFSVDAPWFGRFLWIGTAMILPLAYLVRCLPLTGRAALAGLRQLDPALEEAAAGLGAGAWRILRRVVLPHLRPALLAGLSLAFITALGDFVTSVLLYTFETRPISMEILAALRAQTFGVGAAYGVLLMLLSTGAFLLFGRGDAAP
ncbi:MAG: ABC transporter permease subunit, partial [Acidobacteriota bacterium]